MMTFGITEVMLIIVSVLLLIILFIVVFVLFKKKQNTSNKTAPPTDTDNHGGGHKHSTLSQTSEAFFEEFPPKHEKHDYKKNTANYFDFNNEEENSKTSSIGIESSFNAIDKNSFYNDATENENKTEAILGDRSYSYEQSSYEKSYENQANIIVQYYKNGVLQNYRITGQVAIIGRELSCDIFIDNDNYMSEQHAMLFIKNRSLYIVDLNSKNGTFINDERIRGVVHISSRDKIRIASSVIKIIIH